MRAKDKGPLPEMPLIGPSDPGSVSPPERLLMEIFGRVEEKKRCSVRSLNGAHQCPEVATYALNTETAQPMFSCMRCISGAIFILTKRGSIVVSRIDLREPDGSDGRTGRDATEGGERT